MTEKVNTTAYEAEKEIDNILSSSITKDWSLNNRKLKTVFLNSSIVDLKNLPEEKTRFRKGFFFDDEEVKIPYFFFEIDGVCEDFEEYISILKSLKSGDFYIANELNSLSKNEIQTDLVFYFDNKTMNKNVYKSKDYSIFEYSESFKALIEEKIQETIDENLIFKNKLNREQAIIFAYNAFNLDKRIYEMVNNFNYSGYSPRVILKTEKIKEEDVPLLVFLNKLGVDVIILCISGKEVLSSYISSDFYNFIKLSKVISVYDSNFRNVENKIYDFFYSINEEKEEKTTSFFKLIPSIIYKNKKNK